MNTTIHNEVASYTGSVCFNFYFSLFIIRGKVKVEAECVLNSPLTQSWLDRFLFQLSFQLYNYHYSYHLNYTIIILIIQLSFPTFILFQAIRLLFPNIIHVSLQFSSSETAVSDTQVPLTPPGNIWGYLFEIKNIWGYLFKIKIHGDIYLKLKYMGIFSQN